LKARIEEDRERLKEAKRKEGTWELMRASISLLKEKEGVWRTRRIEECERIKEEEKRDRLAVVSQKKRRYGIKKISKEENLRFKMRTEEKGWK
jgi:hypothetical protein